MIEINPLASTTDLSKIKSCMEYQVVRIPIGDALKREIGWMRRKIEEKLCETYTFYTLS